MSAAAIVINARSAAARLTGVQRYIHEILDRDGGTIARIGPARALHGTQGHLWEQTVLPLLVKQRLLWSPANLGPLAVRRQVVTVHDIAPIDHPEWFTPRFRAWYQWLLPALVRRVTGIITVSQYSKDRLVERLGADPDRVAVIPNGVSDRFTAMSSASIQHMRARLDLGTGPYMLAVGSIEPRKNLRRLLEAWAKVQDRLPKNLELFIAGGVGVARIFGSSATLTALPERVRILGHVPDELLPALYSGALFFAYLSEYEGFGLPLVEAMACGVPTLTSRVTAMPEVAGDAAILVDPTSVDEIAVGIETLAMDDALRRDLALKALRRGKSYSWQATATATIDCLARFAER